MTIPDDTDLRGDNFDQPEIPVPEGVDLPITDEELTRTQTRKMPRITARDLGDPDSNLFFSDALGAPDNPDLRGVYDPQRAHAPSSKMSWTKMGLIEMDRVVSLSRRGLAEHLYDPLPAGECFSPEFQVQMIERARGYKISSLLIRDSSCGYGEDGEFRARFRIGETIAKGKSGVVYDAYDVLGDQEMVLKHITFRGRSHQSVRIDIARLLLEVRILEQLDHPAAVPLYDGFARVSPKGAVIAMPHRGISLREARNQGVEFSERDYVQIAERVSSVLLALAALGVWHRDVKLGNILMKEYDDAVEFSLADFGLAKDLHAEASYEALPEGHLGKRCGLIPAERDIQLGTPPFMAPEIFTQSRHSDTSDVFSLGVVLHRLMTGKFPFGRQFSEVGCSYVKKTPLKNFAPEGVSSEIIGMVEEMLRHDPSDRPSTSETNAFFRGR